MRFSDEFPRRLGGASKTVRCLVIGGALLAFGLTSNQVGAQQAPGVTADQLQQLQQMQQMQRGAGSSTGQSVTSRETILEPTGPQNPVLPISRLERILSERAGVRLRQIGYDQLGVGRAVNLPQVGAIQDSYVLGAGDEIVLTLRGQENNEYRALVDRDGRVSFPRLNPVSAAGRTFGQFREDLVNAIHRAYVSTEGFVSVGRLRQVSVLVSGEVGSPGVRILTGLSTPVDAILVSGGIKKTGSLRNVRIVRAGREIPVDLYSVLTGSARASFVALADGDRIVVPPLGRTAAVVGWVRRPGIYELGAGKASINSRALLDLAGGLEVRGKYRQSVMRVAADGRNQMVTLESGSGTVGDSDILFVLPAASQTMSTATLSGGTALAGKYATGEGKLSEMLRSPGALGEEPYTLFGIISRRDPRTLLRSLIPFTPVAVLNGSEDLAIQNDDIVRVISTRESRILFSAVQQFRIRRTATQEALVNPQSAPSEKPGGTMLGQSSTFGVSGTTPGATGQQPAGGEAGNAAVAGLLGGQDRAESAGLAQRQALTSANEQSTGLTGLNDPRSKQQQYQESGAQPEDAQQDQSQAQGPISTGTEVTRLSDLALQLRVDPLVLINFLDDRAVNVDGAVQGPGLYLVGPDADIQSVLAAAGGVARWADKSMVEVISTTVDANSGRSRTERRTLSLAQNADAAYIVSPRDEVRVNEVYTSVGLGSVTMQGQVRHAGTYQIVRGERLSELLMRAGGLTDTAYPYGTVFLRRSVAQREQDAFRRQAQEIENQLLLALSRRDPNSKLSPEAFQAVQGYVEQIRTQKALGRVVVTADPAVLAANPAADPLLEPNDVIYIPQRPYSVAVLGEVLQPGSVPFRPDQSATDYIDSAGGYSRFADQSETILVLPDGSARRIERSWLSFDNEDIPPGSTIFIARDVSGVDLHQIIVDTTAIVSQLAVSAASLAVLSTQIK